MLTTFALIFIIMNEIEELTTRIPLDFLPGIEFFAGILIGHFGFL